MQTTHKLISRQYVTKEQLQSIISAWGSAAEIPAKGKKSIVCWPMREHAEISYTAHKSGYGKRLYCIEFFRH